MAPQLATTRVTPAADECDVLREQLDYLIEHTAGEIECGCAECRRYLRVRSILLEIFGEPQAVSVTEMHAQLAKAA